MADLTRPYTLKRHRRLPEAERAVFHMLDPSADDVQALREEVAQSTGAAPDGTSTGPERQPVETLDAFAVRQAARYCVRVDRLQDRDGREISFAGMDEAARLKIWRTLPLRVANELSTAAADLDKEEERSSSGSAAT